MEPEEPAEPREMTSFFCNLHTIVSKIRRLYRQHGEVYFWPNLKVRSKSCRGLWREWSIVYVNVRFQAVLACIQHFGLSFQYPEVNK